jgi:hypothetical protein
LTLTASFGCQGSPNDTSLILQLGGDQFSLHSQVGKEPVGFFADSPAMNDQVWPEQCFQGY